MAAAGMILGTAAYMSPEQAKGRPADKRSDIWAFGCVLYEMLTGQRAFEGDDVSDTLAAVLRGQPDWSALPADVPKHIRLLLDRCLEKERSKRVSDIGVAQFLMTETALAPATNTALPPVAARPWWARLAPIAASALAGAGIVGIAIWESRSPSPAPTVMRFSYRLAEDQRFTNAGRQVVAISPDGTRMAYVANQHLYLKTLADADARPISGLPAGGVTSPVFSPDGQWLAYWSLGTLSKVAISGGPPVKLAELDNPLGMSWSGDGLLVGQGQKGILRVPDNGGRLEAVIRVKDGELAHGPQLLPDGRSILFTLASGIEPDPWDNAQIVVQAIGSSDQRTIIRGGTDGRYVGTGHIVYAVGGVLFARRFDVRKLEAIGEPISIVEGVERSNGAVTGSAQFAVSTGGTLVYLPGPAAAGLGGSMVALLDLKGRLEALKLPERTYQSPRFSPNGQQLAVAINDGRSWNIWVYDLDGHTQIRQLTSGGNNRFPTWTGDRITFQSDREGDQSIWRQRADGKDKAERLIKAEQGESLIPDAWSPDGDTLLFSSRTGSRQYLLQSFRVRDNRRQPFTNVQSSNEPNAGFSRDGRWVTYALSGGSGTSLGNVYVRPFPASDEVHIVGPGLSPFWARDRMSLYFVASPGVGAFSLVNVTTEPRFGASEPITVPRPLITGGGPNVPRAYDSAPDGQHLAVLTAPDSSSGTVTSPQIDYVVNWFEELKARVPAK
jgi:Tol biopolymer transport system component